MTCYAKKSNREIPDETYMQIALEEAVKAGRHGEVPIGAILVKDSRVIAIDHNRCIELNDPTAHAEILVLRKAGEETRNYRLGGSTLYVTAEPCPMCAAAMIHARISRLVFGAPEPKFGAVDSKVQLLRGSLFKHEIEICEGVLRHECIEVLQCFFREKRHKGQSY